jgi:hypothetical protein
MSDRAKTQTMLITSIVLAIVSMILMGVMKHSLQQIPFVNRLLQLKNLGVDSMKDFLEVSELNLRIHDDSSSNTSLQNERHAITIEWDSDDSSSYLIFLSSEYIPKLKLIHAESIPDFDPRELPSLQNSSNWTRKILIKMPTLEFSDQHRAAHSKYHPSHVESHSRILHHTITLKKFNCRVRSDYGRISRHLSYPADGKAKLEKKDIDAWIITKGRDYHLCILEATPGSILEYSVLLYIKDGMGLKLRVPPFKDFIDFNLGTSPAALCYLTGTRSVGIHFEQFIGWLGQEKVLYNDDDLKQYLPDEETLVTDNTP